MASFHDEPFEGIGTLAADAMDLKTHGSPGGMVYVRFDEFTAEVVVIGSLAESLTGLVAGKGIRVKGTLRIEHKRPRERVVIADEIELLG